jgi:hypothetical protein
MIAMNDSSGWAYIGRKADLSAEPLLDLVGNRCCSKCLTSLLGVSKTIDDVSQLFPRFSITEKEVILPLFFKSFFWIWFLIQSIY